MTEHGFLVIADITGYTAFLSGTELEHAQDSLKSLLELLVEHTREPLQISRLEGDAVISFALDGSYIKPQMLLEYLETTYIAFRQAQQRMRLNTTCRCNACRNIPNLDLKFFVHHAEFMLQDLGPYTELIGPQVNLIHRLMKNGITENTGIKAYAAFTQAAIEALQMDSLTRKLPRHQEPDEYEGQVTLYIQDMHAVWGQQRDLQRIVVAPEEALLNVEDDLPVGPPLAWDYLTTPEYRAVLDMVDSVEVETPQPGRIVRGSVYVCAHGEAVVRQAIVDWHPFEYFTYDSAGMLPGTSNLTTVYLSPIENGTRVLASVGHTRGPDEASQQWDQIMVTQGPDRIREGCARLRQRILNDLELGIIVQPKPFSPNARQVEDAIAAALANSAL
jgi:hypothetical protein